MYGTAWGSLQPIGEQAQAFLAGFGERFAIGDLPSFSRAMMATELPEGSAPS